MSLSYFFFILTNEYYVNYDNSLLSILENNELIIDYFDENVVKYHLIGEYENTRILELYNFLNKLDLLFSNINIYNNYNISFFRRRINLNKGEIRGRGGKQQQSFMRCTMECCDENYKEFIENEIFKLRLILNKIF